MLNRKITGLAALLALGAVALSACGTVEDGFLDTEANYTVDISVPYATATPLPDYLNVPDAIVIDEDGNVTLNDASIIEGDFQSAREEENQTDYRSLSLGATGIAVQALQSRLEELGYYEGEISGVFDIDTESAVKRFEQTYGTMQTGVATQKLQLRLFAATAPSYGSAAYNEAVVSQYTVLRPGAVGSSVYALQQRLKNLGYPITDLTGAYDAQTALCVRMFYASYGVAATDVADVDMQRRLYAEDAAHYDPELIARATLQPEPEPTVEAEAEDGEAQGATSLADDILNVQRQLIRLGFMAQGGDTGEYDAATVDAVNRFLAANGLPTTGRLGPASRELLFASAAEATEAPAETGYHDLNPGDSGDAVMDLQRRLVALGYANGNPNGKYGNATISAVQLYQALNGLEVDGLASAQMQEMLFASDARSYQEIQGLQPGDAQPTPQPTPEGETLYFNLSAGSNGNAVMELQNRLLELGYPLTPNGSYDDATRLAVAAFQTAIGVDATGEASASLQRYIRSKAAPGPTVRFYNVPQTFAELSLGDTGDGVTRLQQQLFSLNLLKREDVQGSVGTYNEATRQAVLDAQLAMGYDSPDGVAGVEFQSFLYSKYAKKIKR